MSHPSRALAIAIALLLGLSACQQPYPGHVTPTLGLYELSLNTIGAAVLRGAVTAQGAASRLDAQANDSLTFTQKRMTSLVDLQQGVLHLVATYAVTNHTSQTIQTPTFVPVVATGSYSTQGQTPFRQVLTRKGLPATTDGIQLERAYRLYGGVVQEDPTATPLIRNLDTSTWQLTPPSGTTVSIGDQGWQTATLAAGASQDVDFAVSIKLQGGDVGDNDPFRLNLVFTVADSAARK